MRGGDLSCLKQVDVTFPVHDFTKESAYALFGAQMLADE